jgi:hypothetical protein
LTEGSPPNFSQIRWAYQGLIDGLIGPPRDAPIEASSKTKGLQALLADCMANKLASNLCDELLERYRTLKLGPKDPNDLSGAQGYGSQHFVPANDDLPYTIVFENQPTPTAPAETVTVTEQLASNLDWSTFQLGNLGIAGYVVDVPAGRRFYSTRIDATATTGEYVDVTGSFDLTTGLVTWTFTSIDPTTGVAPTGLLAGFLPPNDSDGDGDGFVTYSVQPKAGATTGTTISAQASVVFDTNAPLGTPTFVNTLDAGAPTSTVTALPAESPSSLSLSWSGHDDAGGSGIASYTVYVSDNGGPFMWLTTTAATSTTFIGQAGHTYGFYSVATDNVGNIQPTPAAAQAATEIVPPAPPPPPPVVVMTQVQDVLKKKLVSEVILTFSGSLNAAEAASTAYYRLATAGKHGSFTAKNAGVIKLKQAVYSAANDTVTLTPKKAFALSKPVQLVVNATPPSGLQDTLGRFLDGGTSAVALLSKGKTTIETAARTAGDLRLAQIRAAIDIVLAHDVTIGSRKRDSRSPAM